MLDLLLSWYTNGATPAPTVAVLGHRVGDGLAPGVEARGATITPGTGARTGTLTGGGTRGGTVNPGSGGRRGPIGGGGSRSW